MFFFNISQRTVFSMTQRIEFFYDAKNWTSFWCWLKELNLLLKWLKELNLFLSMTQRIEPLFWIRLNESKPFCFSMWLRNWNFWLKEVKKLNFLFWKLKIFSNDWKNWTRLFQHDSENWTFFFNLTQIFFEIDSKNRTFFSIRLNESNPFFKCDSFFRMISRIEPLFFEKK